LYLREKKEAYPDKLKARDLRKRNLR